MSLKWRKTGQGPHVIELLDELTGLDEAGNVTLKYPGRFEIFVDMLSGYIDFSKEVPNNKRVQITRRAVVDAKKNGGLIPASVLALAHEAQAEFLRIPRRAFVLLASASLKYGRHLRSVRFDTGTISFLPKRPSNFGLPSGGSLLIREDTPSDYSYIKARVSARDPVEAGELAFENIDTLRSIWNLTINGGTLERRSLGRRPYQPVNRIIPGPIHTLHYPDGAHPNPGRWWYATMPQPVPAHEVSHMMERLKRDEAYIRKQVRRCAFSGTLIGLIRQYGRAFDEFDLNNSLLRLWSVLEQLTGPSKGNYDLLVRRTSFLWQDYREARLILDYLRNHRNDLVHAGSSPPDIEPLLYQLKEYVEGAVWYLIGQAHRFASIEDFWSFLDLPPNVDELRVRVRQHRRAIAFRSGIE